MYLAASSFSAFPGGYQGQVSFNGFAIPGVTVTATQGDKKFVAVTDENRHIHISRRHNPEHVDASDRDVGIYVSMKDDRGRRSKRAGCAAMWELKMLPLDDMKAEVRAANSSFGSDCRANATEYCATQRRPRRTPPL